MRRGAPFFFRAFHPARRPADLPRQPRRADSRTGPGITKIRGGMIYNAVMGARDDMAVIVAGGHYCGGADPDIAAGQTRPERKRGGEEWEIDCARECKLVFLVPGFSFYLTSNFYLIVERILFKDNTLRSERYRRSADRCSL